MAQLDWLPQLMSAGIAELDEEHREHLEILNRLQQAIDDDSVDGVRALFAHLIVVSGLHFLREERLLRHREGTLYEEHKQAHDRLLQDMEDAGRTLRQLEDREAKITVLNHLSYWLLGHMMTLDAHHSAAFQGHAPA